MPEASLRYLANTITDQLPSDRPLRVLHVGNFVGVSLCYVSWLVRELHPHSVIVSIDPNIPHLGIENPQSHVVALLDHFDLLNRNLIITGYTLEQRNEATTQAGYRQGVACENVLAGLRTVAGRGFDLALIDGNHDEGYLTREVAAVREVLHDDGIVVFDDVTDWVGVAEVFKNTLQGDSFTKLGDDGRIGILQLHA